MSIDFHKAVTSGTVATISSPSNERVRRVQALLRSTRRRLLEELLVVEGLRLAGEAVLSGLPLTWAFFTPDFATGARGAALIAALTERQTPTWEVTPPVMAALSDTETPQGIVVVLPVPVLQPRPGLALILDGIRDPGNLGTILRTAWAAGVGQTLVLPGCVDFTAPKVLRSAMGAHFHVPVRRISWEQVRQEVPEPVWLADADAAAAPYDRVDWSAAGGLIIGGEAEGAGAEARELSGVHRVTIPMAAGVEPLNAALSAAVLLFEAARQRAAA